MNARDREEIEGTPVSAGWEAVFFIGISILVVGEGFGAWALWRWLLR
jgi:hypothetical protein